MSVITATALTLDTAGRRLLEAVDFAAAHGELVGLIGPNGAGKSTLVRTLAGLVAPSCGRIVLDGRNLYAIPARERARHVGYLAQQGDCRWDMAVHEVVSLGRLVHGDADAQAIDEAMTLTDVHRLGERAVNALSGGERARVLLARVLAGRPRVLLADEPVANLDPRYQLQFMSLLRSLADTGMAVIVVIHDLTLAARFCHRLVVMREGRVVASGAPPLADPVLAQAFEIEAHGGRHRGEPFCIPWAIVA